MEKRERRGFQVSTYPSRGSSLLAGLWPMLHFQFGLFKSINLPPVWAPIKEAALQSLHSAVASCRLSFLFTTDFVCLSPLYPILGTLWTETQHPPSPEQGLAPLLEFQEISKAVSGQQQQASSFAPPSAVQMEGCAPPVQSSCEVHIPITDLHGASLSEPLLLLPDGHLHIHIAYASCKEVPRCQGILFSPVGCPGCAAPHSQRQQCPTAQCPSITQISSTSITSLMSRWAPLPSLAAVQSGPCLHALVEVPTVHLSHSQVHAWGGKPVYM